jgi:hypothetical protein
MANRSLFFSKQGKNGKWKTFMSTNTSLSFIEMVKIYQLRWCIEVFFKESKQLFGLLLPTLHDGITKIPVTTMKAKGLYLWGLFLELVKIIEVLFDDDIIHRLLENEQQGSVLRWSPCI